MRQIGNPYRADKDFAPCPTWILEDPEILDGEVRLYMVLRRYAGKNGIAWPSQERLAKDLGISVRQVQNRLKGLAKKKVIEITTVQENTTKRHNAYRFYLESDEVPDPKSVSPDTDGGEIYFAYDTKSISPMGAKPIAYKEGSVEEGPMKKEYMPSTDKQIQPPSEKTVAVDGTVKDAIIETVAGCERFASQAHSMNGTATDLAKDLLKMCQDTDQIEYELHGWRDWHNENPKKGGRKSPTSSIRNWMKRVEWKKSTASPHSGPRKFRDASEVEVRR
jgi:DNA-binding Lrp family transcriptional regulator